MQIICHSGELVNIHHFISVCFTTCVFQIIISTKLDAFCVHFGPGCFCSLHKLMTAALFDKRNYLLSPWHFCLTLELLNAHSFFLYLLFRPLTHSSAWPLFLFYFNSDSWTVINFTHTLVTPKCIVNNKAFHCMPVQMQILSSLIFHLMHVWVGDLLF